PEILNNFWFFTARADHRKCVAGGAACRVVINRDAHSAGPFIFVVTRLPRSYQPLERFTIHTTESMTGTSTSTPTTVARAAPELKPNRLMAAATASSKKLLA